MRAKSIHPEARQFRAQAAQVSRRSLNFSPARQFAGRRGVTAAAPRDPCRLQIVRGTAGDGGIRANRRPSAKMVAPESALARRSREQRLTASARPSKKTATVATVVRKPREDRRHERPSLSHTGRGGVQAAREARLNVRIARDEARCRRPCDISALKWRACSMTPRILPRRETADGRHRSNEMFLTQMGATASYMRRADRALRGASWPDRPLGAAAANSSQSYRANRELKSRTAAS